VVEWTNRDGYRVTDDRVEIDIARVHQWLSEDSYWATGRPLDGLLDKAASVLPPTEATVLISALESAQLTRYARRMFRRCTLNPLGYASLVIHALWEANAECLSERALSQYAAGLPVHDIAALARALDTAQLGDRAHRLLADTAILRPPLLPMLVAQLSVAGTTVDTRGLQLIETLLNGVAYPLTLDHRVALAVALEDALDTETYEKHALPAVQGPDRRDSVEFARRLRAHHKSRRKASQKAIAGILRRERLDRRRRAFTFPAA